MDIGMLWNDSITIEWWKMLIIGFFLLSMNIIIFLAMWYVRRDVIIEYGYPKRNKKNLRKRLKSHSKAESFFLLRLTIEAERKGSLLYINLACHFVNIVALGTSFCGFLGCMLTLADGWALILLLSSELDALFLTGLIEFIPHIVFLPSERNRYKRR